MIALDSGASGAAFFHAQTASSAASRAPRRRDAAARAFASEERRRLAHDPWAGEELRLTAAARLTALRRLRRAPRHSSSTSWSVRSSGSSARQPVSRAMRDGSPTS